MYCDQCGQPVPAGQPVCGSCGAQLPPGIPTGPPGPVLGRPPAAVGTPAANDNGGAGGGLVGLLRHAPTLPRQRPGPAGPDAGDGQGRRVPPLSYRPGPTVRAWILGATTRNLRGTAVGIVAAWFDLPLVLLSAVSGALFGGIAGGVSGTLWGTGVLAKLDNLVKWIIPLPVSPRDLLPTAAAQLGGILGAILGAARGAWLMAYLCAVFPWQLLLHDDPMWPWAVLIGQVVTALVVGLLYTIYSITLERGRLRLGGARPPSRREREWLEPLVDEVAVRLGLHAVPALLMDDSRAPNAYAGARHIVLTTGLLDEFGTDPDAICGVLAHELTHWADGAPVGRAWSAGTALPLYILYEIAVRVLGMARWRPLQFLLRTLLWSVLVSVRYVVMPVQASGWRREEYRADQGAVAAGYAEGLRRVLERFRDFEVGRTGWERAMCASHPPAELRLERLEQPGGHYPHPMRGGTGTRTAGALDALPTRAASTVRKDGQP